MAKLWLMAELWLMVKLWPSRAQGYSNPLHLVSPLSAGLFFFYRVTSLARRARFINGTTFFLAVKPLFLLFHS